MLCCYRRVDFNRPSPKEYEIKYCEWETDGFNRPFQYVYFTPIVPLRLG
jgi:hypothetical protein